MVNNISEEDIRKEVTRVMHPTINCSLLELGIVKNIEIKNRKIKITMAFPFPNIPIEDYLINSVRRSIEKIDTTVEFETVVMNKEELQKFLTLEKENWRSGV
jgi:metal-sulfur cluster biosynthetic enzyme